VTIKQKKVRAATGGNEVIIVINRIARTFGKERHRMPQINEPQLNQPTNILFLVSDPLDSPISIQHDLLALQDALRGQNAAARFNVLAAEADTVQEHLDRGDGPRYSVLHYLGHGYKLA
jgi:hypothetical protein